VSSSSTRSRQKAWDGTPSPSFFRKGGDARSR
jgi:hypothetical protein